MSSQQGASKRLRDAQEQVDETTRVARLARVAAREALYRRASRRRRALRTSLAGAAIAVVVLAVGVAALAVKLSSSADAATRRSDVLEAARTAVAAMLTADPAQATQYADSVIAASTGQQRERLIAARSELINEISKQPAPSVGVVVSAGLVTDPTDRSDAGAQVLLVAEATNPALIGGDPTQKRMPIAVTMRLVGDHWKVERAGLR